MAMGTLADLEDQEPIPDKESPLQIHLKVNKKNKDDLYDVRKCFLGSNASQNVELYI